MGVGEPGADGDGVLRMEYVRGGGVIDDDGLSEVTSDLRKILRERRVSTEKLPLTYEERMNLVDDRP